MKRALAFALAAAALAAPAAASAAERQVTMQGNQFRPNRVVAITNDTVRWTNKDYTAHTVVGVLFSTPVALNHNDTWTPTSNPFTAPGTYDYHCTIHSGMFGKVAVYDIYLQGPASAGTYGGTVKLTGLAPASASVTINKVGGGTVATVTAGPAGGFTATIPAVPGQYQAVTGLSTSTAVRVAVKAKVGISARKVPGKAIITVKATPNQRGVKVALEKRRNGRWVRVAAARLGATSKTVFRIARTGRMTLRARMLGGRNGYSAGTSRTIVI
jgi:plastocyanin